MIECQERMPRNVLQVFLVGQLFSYEMVKSSRYAAAEIRRFMSYLRTYKTGIWMCVQHAKWIMKSFSDAGPKDFVSIDMSKTVGVIVKALEANCVDLNAMGEEPQGKGPKQVVSIVKYSFCIGKEVEISIS